MPKLSLEYNGREFVEASRTTRIALKIVAGTFEPVKYPGGLIVCAITVNANEARGMLGKMRNWIKTGVNWYCRKKRVRDVVKGTGLSIGYSLGNLFHGKYINRDTGEECNDKSFTLEILDVPYEVLEQIADQLCRAFHQQSVLIKDYATGRAGFYTP